MRVWGYVRVSTEDQATGGVSLAAQRAKIRTYCELYDLELVNVAEDAGVSAKTLDRPALLEALEELRSGAIGGLVIAKLDRLTRRVGDWDKLIGDYFGHRARYGAQLFSVADQIDTRTAAGRLVLNVLMSVAQWEREAIGERTRDALHHKKTKGQRVGEVPFGWDLADDGVHLVENEQEQVVRTLIVELRLRGQSYRQIARRLNEDGVKAKRGGKWYPQSVSNVFKSTANEAA